jgi:hypothetical protein
MHTLGNYLTEHEQLGKYSYNEEREDR